jgi:hypothetical protein
MSKKLLELKPVRFDWIEKPSESSIGFIAEEVYKTIEDVIVFDSKKEPINIRYDMLTPIIIQTLQKMNSKIEALSEQVNAIQQR